MPLLVSNKRLLLIVIVIGSAIALAGGFWLARTRAEVSGIFGVGQAEEPKHISYSLSTELYDPFFDGLETPTEQPRDVAAAVVPHHLVAGRQVARLFERIKKTDPSVVVVIGPNHFGRGLFKIATSKYDWKTPYGNVAAVDGLHDWLVEQGLAGNDPGAVGQDHSMSTLMPFIKRTWPHARVLPIILKAETPLESVNELTRVLSEQLPNRSLVLASIDFSHYLPVGVANWHDETARNVLATLDGARIGKTEIDSQPSLYALIKYAEKMPAKLFVELSHTNSALLVQQPTTPETTSHIVGYFVPGEPTTAPLVTMQFFGDIMLDRNVAKNMGQRGLDYIFEHLRGAEQRFFAGADYFIANLEGPFAPARVPTTKSIAFRFDPTLAKQLKKYNFSGFSLANNHSVDMGWKNVDFTKKILDEQKLFYFGDELREGVQFTRFVTSTAGETIALIGINTTDHSLDMNKVRQAFRAAKERATYVVVMMHWGPEYKRISSSPERELAHQLVDLGATAVIGAHPHVVQEMEVYNGAPIFYSLGNFIFDQYFSKDTQEGLSVGLVLSQGRVAKAYIFPIYGVKSQVRLMTGVRKKEFMEWFGKNSRVGESKFEDGVLDISN